MRKIKKLILIISLLSILTVCFSSCLGNSFESTIFEQDGLTYEYRLYTGNEGKREYFNLQGIDDRENPDSMKTIYIQDRILGCYVKNLGKFPEAMFSTPTFDMTVDNAEKIYFPWSIESVGVSKIKSYRSAQNTVTLFSASTKAIVPIGIKSKYTPYDLICVVPNYMYQWLTDRNYTISKNGDVTIPANIAYFFNYEENPNEGYFFVDLLEETGKLTPPPYNPHREGYTFEGWYKDAECTEAWDFANDEVKIAFDEDGNRIYEEVKLYAKWRWK